jgi:hypothetical protein
MNDELRHYSTEPAHAWARAMQQRGLGGVLRALVNGLEPLGPLGAQALYIAQPALGLLGGWRAAGALARALEQPGGLDALRRILDDDLATQGDAAGHIADADRQQAEEER